MRSIRVRRVIVAATVVTTAITNKRLTQTVLDLFGSRYLEPETGVLLMTA